MAVKQMAISFGIGAVLSGAFTKTFKTAGSIIDEVNKKTAELNQTRSKLDKYKKLQLTKQETLNDILSTNKELKNLRDTIKNTSDTGKNLNKTYKAMEEELSQLKDKQKDLKNRLSQISQEMKQNKGNNSNLREEYKKLKAELVTVSDKLQSGKNNFSKLEKEISENNKETNSLTKQYENLENKMEKLKNTQRKNNEEFEKTKKALEEQNVSVKDIAKSYGELEEKASSYNKALKAYQKTENIKNKAVTISGKGTTALKTAGVITGLVTPMLNSAIRAESSFADVKKQFDFATKEDEEKFKSDLQKIVTEKNIAINLEDLYGMAANAGQSGLKEDEAISYIEEAAKMAVAFNMNRDEASKYMFNWKNAFGMDLTQLKELTDQINILGNNTGATEGQISEFITRLGNIPKLAGMAENQTAALGASLIEMGMAPEVAATGAKKLLNVLSKGMAADKSEREALDILGLDSEYLAVMAKKDSEKAMDIVFSALSKAKEEQQSAIMTMLFGEEGKVAGANILSSYEKYNQNLSLVKNKESYQGATDKEYQNRADTTENKLQVFKTQLEILKADFGTELIPFLQEGLKTITPFIQNLTKMMKENPEGFKSLVKTLVYGTGALYGFGLGLKTISSVMNAYAGYTKLAGKVTEKQLLKKLLDSKKIFTSTATGLSNIGKKGIVAGGKIFKGIKFLFGNIGKVASMGITMLANPIGVAIVGITALVTTGYLLYKNWDTVKQKAIELKQKVGEVIDKYWYMLGPIGYLIKAGKSIYENWDTIKLKAVELKEKLVDMVMNGIENFNEFKDKAVAVLGIPFDYMKQKVENLKNAGKELKDYFLGIFEEIKNFSITGFIKNKASSLWNKGKERFSNQFFTENNNSLTEVTENTYPSYPNFTIPTISVPKMDIPKYATGGIVSSPTVAMIGEGGYSEAVIPLNNDINSLNLWEKTGRLIGAYENAGSQSSYNNEFKFTYAPVVTASNAEGVKEVLENDARMKYEEFKAYFDRYEREMFRRGRNGR